MVNPSDDPGTGGSAGSHDDHDVEPASPAAAHPPTSPGPIEPIVDIPAGFVDDAGRLTAGRCPQCGYVLKGLPADGNCPECGTAYGIAEAARLQPWPDALSIILRLGWPVLLLILAVMMQMPGSGDGACAGMLIGWFAIVAIAVNSWVQIKRILKRSLPEQTRTRGPIAIMRRIGITLCVLILLAFVAVPLVFGITCIIILSSGNGGFH
ncbi:MAG: hypothetical protein KC983_10065 [Phycisphaerales bacterium]|nr:hypothetical protein [Phycisphaerales bacterium]